LHGGITIKTGLLQALWTTLIPLYITVDYDRMQHLDVVNLKAFRLLACIFGRLLEKNNWAV